MAIPVDSSSRVPQDPPSHFEGGNHVEVMEIAVVGGGLSGLVAARRLAVAGHDVTLYEKRPTVGGRVRSHHQDGYIFDRGFQVLFTAYPAVRRELDVEALNLRRFRPGAVLCRPGNRSTIADPLRDPRGGLQTLISRDLSLGDKLRVLALRLQLSGRTLDEINTAPDESIESYLRGRGFSDRFIQNFAKPFYGGITLDKDLSTSKRVFEFTFKMLAEGDIALPAKGMGAIPRQLHEKATNAGADIQTETEVTAVEESSGGARIVIFDEPRTVDTAVIATDPVTSQTLTGVGDIPTVSRGCTTSYYRLPGASLDTSRRILLNANADNGPNEVVPISEVVPEYTPAGETVVSATYLGIPDLDTAELTSQTRVALASWFPDRNLEGLEHLHTDRIQFAQFAQPPGVHETLPDVRAPSGPIYLAGDITRGSSINGALRSGRDVAVAVDADGRSQR